MTDNMLNTVQNQFDAVSNQVVKEEIPDITNIKMLRTYVKESFKKKGIHLSKFKLSKIKDEIVVDWNVGGRLFVEEFSDIDDLNKCAENISSRITKVLNDVYEIVPQTLNHSDRRKQLKNTDYFKNKKKFSYTDWRSLIASNIQRGNEAHSNYLNQVVKSNINYLLYKEERYRNLLTKLGHDKKEIEQMVEAWYDVVIKDGSFMTEK